VNLELHVVGGSVLFLLGDLLFLYQASFILPHCLWLSLLPTTPNTHFVVQKEGQSRELVIMCDFMWVLENFGASRA
jgi:hypothetical protein